MSSSFEASVAAGIFIGGVLTIVMATVSSEYFATRTEKTSAEVCSVAPVSYTELMKEGATDFSVDGDNLIATLRYTAQDKTILMDVPAQQDWVVGDTVQVEYLVSDPFEASVLLEVQPM